jgi:hypothetical protein
MHAKRIQPWKKRGYSIEIAFCVSHRRSSLCGTMFNGVWSTDKLLIYPLLTVGSISADSGASRDFGTGAARRPSMDGPCNTLHLIDIMEGCLLEKSI